MKEHLIGILVALPQEAHALFGKLGWSRSGMFPVKVERFRDFLVMIAVSGQGKARAAAATKFLLRSNPLFLINMGVAGALAPDLASGDLVIPGEVTDQAEKIGLASPVKQVLDNLLGSLGVDFKKGLLVTSSETVDSPEAKIALFRASGAIAVDMEAFAMAEVCKRSRLPCFVVKAITDSQSQTIPKAITSCLSETGHISFARFTITLLSRPWLIPRLVEMQKSFKSAIFSLEQVKVLLSSNLSRDSLIS